MSVAEKLTTIAENVQKVYDAGKAAGGGGTDLGKLCAGITFDLNVFDTSEIILNLDNVTSLRDFCYVANSKTLNQTVEHITLNCSKPITEMYRAFNGNTNLSDAKLKQITLNADTSKVTNFTNGFVNCTVLETIDGNPLDFTSCTALNQPFRGCSALVNLRVVSKSINISFAIQYSPNLSDETIQSIIDGLYDLTGDTAKTLTLHATVGAKLTDEQKAAITAKNWELVY